jgi:hypothetical protein
MRRRGNISTCIVAQVHKDIESCDIIVGFNVKRVATET